MLKLGTSPTNIRLTRLGVRVLGGIIDKIKRYFILFLVFRGRVLKGYRTSANRTVYHVSVTNSYKNVSNLSSVILVRVPGVSCPCPQLQVGLEYVLMGWVRAKRKSVSKMTLLSKNFAQKWDEGFEEELSSIRSSCKKSVVDGPLVQSIAVVKGNSSFITIIRKS